jgi:hypothetical protein
MDLKHVNEGIEALRDVRTYLMRLFHDHSEVWTADDDALAVAVETKLRQSTELWDQLLNAAIREQREQREQSETPAAPNDAA